MTDTPDDHEAEGAMRWAMGTRNFHKEQASEVERLRAEVERLMRERDEAIEAAYREGWWDGEGNITATPAMVDRDWLTSDARAALAETEE